MTNIQEIKSEIFGQIIRKYNIDYYNDELGQRVTFYMIIKNCYILGMQLEDSSKIIETIKSLVYIFNCPNDNHLLNKDNIKSFKKKFNLNLAILFSSLLIEKGEEYKDIRKRINKLESNTEDIKPLKHNIIFTHQYDILINNIKNKIQCNIEKLSREIVHTSIFLKCKLNIKNNNKNNRLLSHPFYGV